MMRTRTEKHPFRMVAEDRTEEVRAMQRRLEHGIKKGYPGIVLPATAYAVKARRGCSKYRERAFSVPVWALDREAAKPGYAVWYVAHEMAHQYAYHVDGHNGHGPLFMKWLRRICPKDVVHYELGYKPRNAKAAGISKQKDLTQPTTLCDNSTTVGIPLPFNLKAQKDKTMSDQDFDFQIDEGVEIPKREITGRQSGTQYPFDKMKPGSSFFLPVVGEDGATRKDKAGNVFELTAAEDLQRQQRQKQSYFSQLGKKLGISITTRTYDDGSEYSPKYAGVAGLGVWHNGERTDTDDAAASDISDDDIGDDEA